MKGFIRYINWLVIERFWICKQYLDTKYIRHLERLNLNTPATKIITSIFFFDILQCSISKHTSAGVTRCLGHASHLLLSGVTRQPDYSKCAIILNVRVSVIACQKATLQFDKSDAKHSV